MTRAGIIGAGITGLTTAYHLAKAGISVTVYESSDHAGGVIRSRRDGDWLAEGGPNTILETSPRIRGLVDELGLSGRRQYSDPGAGARYVVRNAQPVSLPASPLQFFACGLYSWRAKARLLLEPFISRGPRDQSVADFVRRRLGSEFLDYGIDPLVTGIYAGDPERLSLRHAFPKIHNLETTYGSLIRGQILGARERKKRGEVAKDRAQKFSFDDGLQVLPDTLRARLGTSLRERATVTALRRTEEGWSLQVDQEGTVDEPRHQVVVVCTTAHAAARLRFEAPGMPPLTSLGSIDYPPVTSVVLGFPRERVTHPCCGFGALIPHREGFGILGTIFSSSLFPRRAPAGHVTLTTYVGGARNREAAALPDAELEAMVLRELGRLFGASGAPVFRHVQRWPKAIPQYTMGYDAIHEELARAEAAAPGLLFAGHYRDGVALSDSIVNGERTAARVQEHLRAPAPTPGSPVP